MNDNATPGARIAAQARGGIPLIADADTGYGAPINVVRTVREYEHAGVAAILCRSNIELHGLSWGYAAW
jgi:2-methylisocitrate lyase-like PEP mutase family enzyme